MNTTFISKVHTTIKRLQLDKLLLSCLAAAFLILGTIVFSGGEVALATSMNQAGRINDGVPANPVASDYEVTPREGGMNNHRDIDVRRMNTKKIDAEAKALIDQSSEHLKNRTGNPAEAVSRVFDRAPDALSDAKRNLTEGSSERLDNLQDSASSLGSKVKDSVGNAADTIKTAFEQNINDNVNKLRD